MTEEEFDEASLCRALAARWLESAEHAPNHALKRCYEKRGLRYLAIAASLAAPEPLPTRH
jgi:hypothetical protein